MDTIKMVEVTRSDFTESVHRGTAVLINSTGEILKEWGNSNILIYPRSALKPIQSLNLYKEGDVFQYVSDLSNTDSEEMNFDGVEAVLNDKAPVKTLHMEEGTLVLFRRLNSLHRVTPTIGNRTRILVVLTYNNKADVSLSEIARMTFFGRLS